jgi:hypothetical protein
MSIEPENDDGIVLVEVLVAFAILIGVITAGVQIFGDGMNRSRQAADRAARVAEAASVFASLPDIIMPGTTQVPSTIPGRNFTLRVVEMQSNAPESVTRRPALLNIFDEGAESGSPLFTTVVLAGPKP